MEEKTLLKIALITSIIGLFGLYFAATNATLPNFDSKNIEHFDGKDVFVEGKVQDFQASEKFAKLVVKELKYGNKVDAIIFKSHNESLNFTIGSDLIIIGEIRQFNGKYEIVASKIMTR